MFVSSLRRATRLFVTGGAALLALGIGPSVHAQPEWAEGTDCPVDYGIEARLEPQRGGDSGALQIVGTTRIKWQNRSSDAVSVLYLHLYVNAFRDKRSTFLREFIRDGAKLPDDHRFGEIELGEMTFTAGEQLTPEFVSPDDGNPDDRTVVRVPLPEPVQPGEHMQLTCDFTTRLPSVIKRMGQHEDFVMAAQWYPKLGRYLGTASDHPNLREGWYCHQYHWATEFYADFADYTVTLTVPEAMVVGSTGKRQGDWKRLPDRGMKVATFEAASVVDFTWVASPRFKRYRKEIDPNDTPVVQREKDRLSELLGIPRHSLRMNKVNVTVLLQPEHQDQADRHFRAAKEALGLYGLWLGPYPYRQLTVVDPPFGGRAAGGMEYPQLITAGTRIDSPIETQSPEGVTLHEVGHQWFMNLLATNEAEEAWLDEGMNTYFTQVFLDLAYGKGWGSTRLMGRTILTTSPYKFPGATTGWPSWFGLPEWATPPEMDVFVAWRDLPWLTGLPTQRSLGDPLLRRRRGYVRRSGWDDVVTAGWEFRSRATYGGNVYSRGALFLNTIRRHLMTTKGEEEGERLFVRAMREYASRFRFAHPTTDDFLRTVHETTGWDPSDHVAALLRTPGTFDPAVESIRNYREGEDEDGEEKGPWKSEVVVRHRGQTALPVRLQVTRDAAPADEATWETVEWDGKSRWKRFTFDGKIVAARIDPEAAYLQDIDLTNNSRTTQPNHRPAAKWGVRFLVWVENVLLSYGRFF